MLQYNSQQLWRLIYFVVSFFLDLHAYHFHNAYRKLCVVEHDCVWSSLIKLHEYTVFLNVSMYFVWCDQWLVQIAPNVCHVLFVVDRFFLYWKTRGVCLFWEFVFLGSIQFWLLNVFHWHFRCDRCTVWNFWQKYIVLQCKINEVTSWHRNYLLNVLEFLGNTRSVWKRNGPRNFWSSSIYQTSCPSFCGHCEVP